MPVMSATSKTGSQIRPSSDAMRLRTREGGTGRDRSLLLTFSLVAYRTVKKAKCSTVCLPCQSCSVTTACLLYGLPLLVGTAKLMRQ
jgi:hypothetical protein